MIRFVKVEGCGNDYLFLDTAREKLPDDRSRLARDLCHPHFGPGGDGIVLFGPSGQGDARMEIYNADGSRAEMCGNAIRGLCLLLLERERKDFYRVETDAGLKLCQMLEQDGQTMVQVDMGAPVWEPGKIPCRSEKNIVANEPIQIMQEEFLMTCVSMGNPHAVIFVPSVASLNLEELGIPIEHNLRFPNRTNVEFVQIQDRNHVKVRVWERGVGETLACGTGACAVLAAGRLTGKLDDLVKVKLPGGTLQVQQYQEKGSIFLTGPVHKVYEGFWYGASKKRSRRTA